MPRPKGSSTQFAPVGVKRTTRRDTQKLLIDRYSQCKVRIARNAGLEELLRVRRSAKITARRKTVALDNYVAPSIANRSTVLFNKITNKPFMQRRHSVGSRNGFNGEILRIADQIETRNMAVADTSAVQSDNERELGVPDANGLDGRPDLVKRVIFRSAKQIVARDTMMPSTSDVQSISESQSGNGTAFEPTTSIDELKNATSFCITKENVVSLDGNEYESIVVADTMCLQSDKERVDGSSAPDVNGFDGQPVSVGAGTDDVQSNNDSQSGSGTAVEPTTIKTLSSTDGSGISTLQSIASSDEMLLPFLPSVTLHNGGNGTTFLQTILDSSVPNDYTLLTPIEPLPPNVEGDLIRWEDAPSILDFTVSVSVDLPEPIAPLKENQTMKKAVPSLLPICDMKKKTYGSAKKVSKTSQLILNVLDKYQQQQQSVTSEEINMTIDYESDENIGRLTYDSDSD